MVLGRFSLDAGREWKRIEMYPNDDRRAANKSGKRHQRANVSD